MEAEKRRASLPEIFVGLPRDRGKTDPDPEFTALRKNSFEIYLKKHKEKEEQAAAAAAETETDDDITVSQSEVEISITPEVTLAGGEAEMTRASLNPDDDEIDDDDEAFAFDPESSLDEETINLLEKRTRTGMNLRQKSRIFGSIS